MSAATVKERTMSRSSVGPGRLRFVLGSGLLLGIVVLVASCAEAIGALEYRDAFAETCELAERCYGGAFEECDERLATLEQSGEPGQWLSLASGAACLEGCDVLYRCLDFAPICGAIEGGSHPACTIDDDCCDFSTGGAVCENDACCRPLGAACTVDDECCPNVGECIGGTCGGEQCAQADDYCLNDFQCCTGRCSDAHRCEEAPCPPEGFVCATDADCCDMICNPKDKRCFDPPDCSLLGQPCIEDGDCCDSGYICHDGGMPGSGGVCSPAECSPNNVDCIDNEDCCTGYCVPPPYRLCGECAAEGEECNDVAAPCCGVLLCGADDRCFAPDP